MITSSRKFKKKKRTSLYNSKDYKILPSTVEHGSYFTIFLILLALGCLILFLNLNFKIIKERRKVGEELSSLGSEIEKLESEKKDFLSKISEVKSDEYLEKVGREEFSLKREGEKVVAFFFPVIEEEKEKESEVEKKNFLKKISDWWLKKIKD